MKQLILTMIVRGSDGAEYGCTGVLLRESMPVKGGSAGQTWTPEAMENMAQQLQGKTHTVEAKVVDVDVG